MSLGRAAPDPGTPPRLRRPDGWARLIAILVLAGSVLGGCGAEEAPDTATGDRGAQDTAGGTTGISPGPVVAESVAGSAGDSDGAWETFVTNAGAALTLSVRGEETLRVACAREPREMTVDLPGFSSITSEERLSFGIDDEPYVFVAQVTPPPPAGVHATGPIDEGFLTALQDAHSISAAYGSQSTGPHVAPDSAVLQLFLSACRQAQTR